MSIEIAKLWLHERARSTNERDIDAHIDLVSKQFQLLGPDSHGGHDYHAWARNITHKLCDDLSEPVSYAAPRIKAELPGRVMFETTETGPEGKRHIEVILQCEEDGKWRALQEKKSC